MPALKRSPKEINGKLHLLTNYKFVKGKLVIKSFGCWIWPLKQKEKVTPDNLAV